MTKESDQLFQDRVDELLMMEQRVELRTEKFTHVAKRYQEKNAEALDDLLGKVSGIDKSLNQLNAASKSIGDYVAQCARYADNATRFVLSLSLVAVLIVVGTLWWASHVRTGLVQDRADLNRWFNVTLKQKPLFKQVNGKDYVRVVPDSEMKLPLGKGYTVPGRYAEVWHVR